ncbi:hypothetical protein K490DRAFT_58134 [Saccharata proteae CBS 121410]|uniref:Uncharacterized protein n=1 Tax=Saccharata proteae CBS 121410 TaxID=1314787 RepID=A0A9P4HSP1_9PEZI|nr:hypothetical protein K490DRAFT_58134 [Saccharata proteae CBS 121410]
MMSSEALEHTVRDDYLVKACVAEDASANCLNSFALWPDLIWPDHPVIFQQQCMLLQHTLFNTHTSSTSDLQMSSLDNSPASIKRLRSPSSTSPQPSAKRFHLERQDEHPTRLVENVVEDSSWRRPREDSHNEYPKLSTPAPETRRIERSLSSLNTGNRGNNHTELMAAPKRSSEPTKESAESSGQSPYQQGSSNAMQGFPGDLKLKPHIFISRRWTILDTTSSFVTTEMA